MLNDRQMWPCWPALDCDLWVLTARGQGYSEQQISDYLAAQANTTWPNRTELLAYLDSQQWGPGVRESILAGYDSFLSQSGSPVDVPGSVVDTSRYTPTQVSNSSPLFNFSTVDPIDAASSSPFSSSSLSTGDPIGGITDWGTVGQVNWLPWVAIAAGLYLITRKG